MKVLVLHASALHLGFLGCYGNTWISTPNLDRLAAEGVVFDQHYADNFACRTAWTGSYDWKSLKAEPVVRQLLASQGIPFVHVQSDRQTTVGDATPLERALENTVDAIESLGDQPHWLCWVDLPTLYPPWNVADEFTQPYLAEESSDDEEDDEPFEPLPNPAVGPLDPDDLVAWERIRCTYGGAVTYLDAGLGLLLDELKSQGQIDDLTIIVAADRGLALGEHAMIGDWRPWLHEEVVHVPLIIRQPGGADAGRRVFALTQPVDLAATLLDLFQIPLSPMDGRSWLPLLRDDQDQIRDHCISAWQQAGVEEWAMRTLEWALLLPVNEVPGATPRVVQLYRKPEDRWELNNVIQHHLELAEEMERKLRELC